MDRDVAREKIVEELREMGNLVSIEDYSHNVGKCYRCGT
jgi:valyl-tRNA synthetase